MAQLVLVTLQFPSCLVDSRLCTRLFDLQHKSVAKEVRIIRYFTSGNCSDNKFRYNAIIFSLPAFFESWVSLVTYSLRQIGFNGEIFIGSVENVRDLKDRSGVGLYHCSVEEMFATTVGKYNRYPVISIKKSV